MTDTELNRSIALFIIRAIAGILFFFQAYDKIVKLGIKNVVNTFRDSLSNTFLKGGILTMGVYISSYIELTGGVLLFAGLGRDYVIYILGVNLLLVSFVFSMIKPLWDMQYFFPRLLLLLILLLCPVEWDKFTLDNLIGTL